MKIKSIVAMLAMLAISVSSVAAVPASAAPEHGSVPVSPQYTYASDLRSSITVSGGTATCYSYGKGKSNVKSMNCTQYLEKQNAFGSWTIEVASWYKYVEGNSLEMTNSIGVGSGTYRLRSVFTFYAVGGNEEVTIYAY